MRHVWILNHYAVWPDGVGSTRHYSLAKHLVSMGWDASIISSSVEHATGRQCFTSLTLKKIREVGPVRFMQLRNPSYRGNGIGRIINIVTYAVMTLLPGMMSGLPRPDVIIGSSVHPLAAFSACILASRYKVPFVFEIRDLWPRTLVDMGYIGEKSAVSRFLYWLERCLLKRANKVVVLLPKAIEYAESFGVTRDKIVWIPNGCDEAGLVSENGNQNNQEKLVFSYIGAHGYANDLKTLLDALHISAKANMADRFLFKFIGDGPLKSELVQYAEDLGLNNVVFVPAVPKKEVSRLASSSDALFITVRNYPGLYKYGISMNKIFDYMNAGRPVVIAVNAANNPVNESGCGITVPPESPGELANAIKCLVDMSQEERLEMGRKGKQYIQEHHDYEKLSKRLASVLNGLSKGPDTMDKVSG